MKLPFNIHASFFNEWVYFSLTKVGFFHTTIGRQSGLTGCMHLGQKRWISFRLGADPDEQIAWEFGPFCYTIPETEEQRLEREDAEAEAAFMDREANRYTEWSY